MKNLLKIDHMCPSALNINKMRLKDLQHTSYMKLEIEYTKKDMIQTPFVVLSNIRSRIVIDWDK